MVTVCPDGWVVIEGAWGPGGTVKVAASLVTAPAELLTTTLNWLPVSELAMAGVVGLTRRARDRRSRSSPLIGGMAPCRRLPRRMLPSDQQ